jgi:hypothetical protein
VAVELECPSCQQETRHEVHYVARLLHRLECEQCGHRWDVSHRWLFDAYLRAFPRRIASKPMRMAREARRHPLAFILSLPIRLFSKPARVAGEVGAVTGMLDE